jgi:hypothetical protein
MQFELDGRIMTIEVDRGISAGKRHITHDAPPEAWI